MFKLFIISSVFLIWRIFAEDDKILNRRKRIHNGLELRDRNSGYAVSRYIIWMPHVTFCSSNSNRPSWSDGDLTVICDVDYKKLRCGGALLTPTIVQTACHCVADTTPYVEGKPSRYILLNINERRLYIFAGWNVAKDMKKGYGAVQYVINERCANYNIRNSTANHPYPLLFDYGLIIVKSRIEPYAGFNTNINNYAPLYTIHDLESMWRRVLSKQLVCLFAGYGDDTSGLEELRHGWGTAQSNFNCQKLTKLPDKTENFNYQNDATFGCFLSLPKHTDRVVRGDSGGPVTCDNEYVGLVSFLMGSVGDDDNSEVRMVMAAPLVFSAFENSAEHRQSLNQLDKSVKTVKSLPRPAATPRSTIKPTVTTPQDNRESAEIDKTTEIDTPTEIDTTTKGNKDTVTDHAVSCSCLFQSVDFLLCAKVISLFFINKNRY